MIVAITLVLRSKQTKLQLDFPSDWGVTAPLLLWVLIDPLPLTLFSLLLPVLFNLFLCLFLLYPYLCFSLQLVLRANKSKTGGKRVAPLRPPACTGFLFCSTVSSRPGNQAVHHSSPANTFTTFKLATLATDRASTSHVSRCCKLLFLAKAAAVNLCFLK